MDTTSKKKSNKINKKINLDTTLETALQELNTYSNKDILTEEEEVKKNNYLKIKEKYNRQELESENFPKFLFPNLDDPNFNVELIEKKQFNILKKPVIKNYDNLFLFNTIWKFLKNDEYTHDTYGSKWTNFIEKPFPEHKPIKFGLYVGQIILEDNKIRRYKLGMEFTVFVTRHWR